MARIESVIDIEVWRRAINKEPVAKEPAAAGNSEPIMAELQTAFRGYLPRPLNLEPVFDGALGYLLDHPGSMVRPRIVYRIAAAYGVHRQAAIDLAIALEYFHTASLVFDDLPCMDNASMRRDAPCVHLPYGESSAILAGLALINRAYGLVWRAVAASQQQTRSAVLVYLERHLGVDGLLNGQSLDLNYHAVPHTLEATERVAKGKTVSLISLTLALPAMMGGACQRELQLLERISRCWGLGYQIVDDLKDVLQSSSEIGKTAARDAYLDRPNIALTVGVPAAVSRLGRLLHAGDRALNVLLSMRSSFVFLRELRTALKDELDRVIEGAHSVPIDRKR